MSLLSRLFGDGAPKSQDSKREDYQGFAITPEPAREGARFRVGARIEKEIGGTLKSHTLIRADTLEDLDTAVEASIRKAKQVIDEQGDRLFD